MLLRPKLVSIFETRRRRFLYMLQLRRWWCATPRACSRSDKCLAREGTMIYRQLLPRGGRAARRVPHTPLPLNEHIQYNSSFGLAISLPWTMTHSCCFQQCRTCESQLMIFVAKLVCFFLYKKKIRHKASRTIIPCLLCNWIRVFCWFPILYYDWPVVAPRQEPSINSTVCSHSSLSHCMCL